jgi:hypothetical protein
LSVLEAGLTQDSCQNSSEDYKITQVFQCMAKPLWQHDTISSEQRCVGVPLLFYPKRDALDRALKGYNLTYIACSSFGVRWRGFSDTTDKRFRRLVEALRWHFGWHTAPNGRERHTNQLLFRAVTSESGFETGADDGGEQIPGIEKGRKVASGRGRKIAPARAFQDRCLKSLGHPSLT